MPCVLTIIHSSSQGMTQLKMSPLVPIGELDRVPLGECSTNESRLCSCQPPTVARSYHQHPRYWVDGKTVVGGETSAWRLLKKGTPLKIPPDLCAACGCTCWDGTPATILGGIIGALPP